MIRFILPILLKDLMSNYQLGMVIAQGVAMVAIVGSVYTVKRFGRRTLILVGHSAIAIELIVVGIC